MFQENAYQYFKKEIGEAGNKKIKKLEDEIEQIKEKSLKAFHEEIADTILKSKENELNEMNLEHSAALNRLRVANHKEIIKKKHDLLESVLLEVQKKLLKFVETEEYKEKMILLVKKIDKDFCGDEILFQIKKKDKIIKDILKENFKNKYVVEEDETIKIGGFKAICLKKGILTDQSIDSSLEEKRRIFFQTSKLNIE